MNVRFFDEHIKRFVEELTMPTSAKVFRTFELLDRFGHQLGMPHSKHIGHQLFELRTRGAQEVRIFYVFHKDSAVLLHGYIKKSLKIPQKELSIAHQKVHALDPVRSSSPLRPFGRATRGRDF